MASWPFFSFLMLTVVAISFVSQNSQFQHVASQCVLILMQVGLYY